MFQGMDWLIQQRDLLCKDCFLEKLWHEPGEFEEECMLVEDLVKVKGLIWVFGLVVVLGLSIGV